MGSRSSTIGCLRCSRSRGGWKILSCGRGFSVLPLLSGWLSLLCRRIVAVDILKGGIRDSAAVHAKFSLVDVLTSVQEFNFLRPTEPESKVVYRPSLVHVLVDNILSEVAGQAVLHVAFPVLYGVLGDLEPVLGVVRLYLEHQDWQEALTGSGWVAFSQTLHLWGPDFVEVPSSPVSSILLKQSVLYDHVHTKEVNPDIVYSLLLPVLVHGDGSKAAPDLIELLVHVLVLLGYGLLDEHVSVFPFHCLSRFPELRFEFEQVENQLLTREMHYHSWLPVSTSMSGFSSLTIHVYFEYMILWEEVSAASFF